MANRSENYTKKGAVKINNNCPFNSLLFQFSHPCRGIFARHNGSRT
jgi:hypothetical protein